MVVLLNHVDAISRQLGRDVVWVEFNRELRVRDWTKNNLWTETTDWLKENGFDWSKCFQIANTSILMGRYDGSLILDSVCVEDSTGLKKLDGYFEKPDGTPTVEGRMLWILTLDVALKNAHHDEPGFWEECADNF